MEIHRFFFMFNLKQCFFRAMRLNAATQVCPYLSENIKLSDHFASESIHRTLQEIAPTLNESIAFCRWRDIKNGCINLMVPTLTDHGLCFSFNTLNWHEMYTEE